MVQTHSQKDHQEQEPQDEYELEASKALISSWDPLRKETLRDENPKVQEEPLDNYL